MEKSPSTADLGPFQIFVLVLSLFVLTALAAELVFDVPAEMVRVIGWIDDIVCLVFFVDFVIRFRKAESKREFMKWGWIDLLAAIPEIEALRWGRALRIFRVLRLIRAVRSLKHLLGILFKSRTRGGVASVGMVTFLVLAMSSVGILFAEQGEDSNITTAEDAVWWSVTTITTVGYGDHYPVTLFGRMIAACLMFAGVGLFGTLSGVIASFFLGDGSERGLTREKVLREEVARLHAQIATLRAETAVRAEDEDADDT